MFSDEGSGGQIEDQRAIELFVEAKVKILQGLLWISKLGLFLPALKQGVGSSGEFI
jgi:hypothetical protein